MQPRKLNRDTLFTIAPQLAYSLGLWFNNSQIMQTVCMIIVLKWLLQLFDIEIFECR